jgi:steroid delta-isomerase-like uncharacterized protein
MPISRFLCVSRRTTFSVVATAAALTVSVPRTFAAANTEAKLLTRWADGWSTLGDPHKLLAVVTPDIVYEDVAAGDTVRGTEPFRGLLAEAAKAIPNFRVELFDGFTTDTMAAAEYEITGTQTGDLPYLKATGKPFHLRAASVFVIENDKIKRESRYYDMARFLTQIGGLPSADLRSLGTPAAKPGGRS